MLKKSFNDIMKTFVTAKENLLKFVERENQARIDSEAAIVIATDARNVAVFNIDKASSVVTTLEDVFSI